MMLSPLTIGARLGGHPEELLAGALCVGAVLAALHDRPLLAGALLGLALGTKQWTLVAVVPVFIACRAARIRMLAVAAAVGAPLALALPLADPAAFSNAAKLIGNLNEVSLLSWWFPFSVSHTVTVQVIGGPATATSHLLPFGLTRTRVFWLIPAVAVFVGWIFQRCRDDRDPMDALGLLALLVLLRCTLDPSNVSYYHAPFVIALLSWETVTRRGVPLISLLTIAGIWGLEYHVFTTAPLVAGYVTIDSGADRIPRRRAVAGPVPWPGPRRSARDLARDSRMSTLSHRHHPHGQRSGSLRRSPAGLLTAGALAVASLSVQGSGDYQTHGAVSGDNAGPALLALAHGQLGTFASHQPLMGLSSLIVRAPFVALGSAIGASGLTGYRLGVLACLLPCALFLAWAIAKRSSPGPSPAQCWPPLWCCCPREQ